MLEIPVSGEEPWLVPLFSVGLANFQSAGYAATRFPFLAHQVLPRVICTLHPNKISKDLEEI